MKRLLWALALLGCGDDAAPSASDSDDETGDEPTGGSATTGCSDALAIECPPAIEVACEGPQTLVEVATPEPACPEWIVEGDAPTSYPVGVTAVMFTVSGDGMEASCATEVAIVDEVAPAIACPPPAVLVRAREDVVVQAPPATATDTCDEAPMVTASANDLPLGYTAVTYTAVDASGNASMCTTDFGVVDAFAVPGFRILSARLVDTQTEVTLAWEPPLGEHVDALRIETAAQEDGPWQELDTVANTEQLFTVALADDHAWFRVVSVASEGEGGATAPRRAFRIAPELYDLDAVAVPGVPFATTLYGVVRHPSALAEGPFPLVLMLHGNHGNCRDTPTADDDYCITSNDHDCAQPGAATTPNAEGYVYLLETLAAQGFVTASISANALNCRDDFILERSALVAEHLRQWSAWSSGNSSGPFGGAFMGALDLDRVGLMGHSRGGDAIGHVHEVLENDPIAGLTVRSLFAVAPTDYHGATIPQSDLAVLLPSCDGDVADLHGMRHYDRAIDFDDGARRAQVLHVGGNHNFYNTEWKISEWELFGGDDPFCTPDETALAREQTAMLEGVLGSWFWTTLGTDDEPEAFVRADAPSPSAFDVWAEAPLELRWSYSSGDRVLVDDFSDPGAPAINALGETNTFENWYEFGACFANACDPFFLHQRNVVRLLWEQGHAPLATFWLGGYDTSDYDTLSFRVVSRRSTLNEGLDEQDFVVRVTDTNGGEVELALSEIDPLAHLYPHSNPYEVMETVRLPLAELATRGVDLDTIESLQLEMTALDRSGSVIVADIELAD